VSGSWGFKFPTLGIRDHPSHNSLRVGHRDLTTVWHVKPLRSFTFLESNGFVTFVRTGFGKFRMGMHNEGDRSILRSLLTHGRRRWLDIQMTYFSSRHPTVADAKQIFTNVPRDSCLERIILPSVVDRESNHTGYSILLPNRRHNPYKARPDDNDVKISTVEDIRNRWRQEQIDYQKHQFFHVESSWRLRQMCCEIVSCQSPKAKRLQVKSGNLPISINSSQVSCESFVRTRDFRRSLDCIEP
jgi:hypothetical protein